MCKKDTDGGSYCCCKCCTPTVSSIVVAIVGAAILVASFVIAAVVLTMLQDGIVKTARYNSPRSDSKAFNDWLSNVPSKRSTNDAALKYYQYYFFNITNLDAVIANGLSNTPSLVYPTVEEIGPYTYRYFVDRLDPTFDADDERLTYKEYYRYIFDASLSKMGSRNLDDQTDVFTTISLVYSSMFGNPFQETGRMPTSSGLFGSPEIGFRFVTGFQLWAPYLQWLDTVGRTSVNGSLFNPLEFGASSAIPLPACIANPLSVSCYQSIFAVQTVMTNVFTPNMKAKYPLGSASAFVDFGNQLLPAGQNKWSDAIPIEYWAFVATNGNNPLWYITSPTVMTKLLNSTLLNIGGCQFALGAANSAGCWASADVTTLNAAVAPRVGLSSDQVDGLKAYAKYVINDYWNWLMKSNGHLGHLYGSQVRAADAACAANQPTASYLSYTYTGTGGCVTFNNANMYVQATPRSLLFEQYNTLGAFLFATSTRTFNRRGNLSFSTNYTSELDSRQDSWQYTVGTGINHINDIDNLYLWKNKTQINTDLTGTWCHKSSDPTYAPSGIYPMQHFTIIPGYTYFQANQAQMTKYTPSYPPGKVSDSNRYSFEKSIISDKSFALDLFVGDISRHAKMVFYRDASIKGIDIQRYTIDESEFNSGLLFFGQYFYGLANYSCPAAGGVNTFSCYPRYGKLNSTVLAAANNLLVNASVNGSVAWTTGIDLATIVNLPNNDEFLANAQFGANFGDANELIAMIDLEPVSGAALGGTLKQQVNVLVQPYIGATLGVYKQTKTVLGNASPFGAYFKSAAPNAPLGRATLFPVYWLNKIGFLSDKQADTFKSTVYGAQLASRVVLIVGTIVGGLMFFVALGFVLVKRRAGYNTQTSKSDLAL